MCNVSRFFRGRRGYWTALCCVFLLVFPPLLGVTLIHAWGWNFAVPFAYGSPGADEIWQLITTKTLVDTGWVLKNPFLGAPSISEWYNNSGAQTSAIHSIIMLGLSAFIKDAVAVQQAYFILNFSLISLVCFITARACGVSRILSCCIGMLFAFTTFRIHALFYAFLSNYFMIPISVLPSIWIMTGKLDETDLKWSFFRSRAAVAILIVFLTAISDGYYAFFALLILGFATIFRVLTLKRLSNLIAPALLILTMFATVAGLQYPIHAYRNSHPEQADQDAMKQPGEAEVYAPSLKLLITPTLDHRIAALGRLSKWMIDTSNFGRKFPYTAGAPAPLGAVCVFLLFGAFIVVLVRGKSNVSESSDRPALLWSVSVLAIFVLLCTMQGGIGSIVALVYPSIRAYERFALFLIFILLLGGGVAGTELLRQIRTRSYRTAAFGCAILITFLGILDQVPPDVLGISSIAGRRAHTATYLAERSAVHQIESSLPENAMLYQYPFSQFLSNNKFYGWGAFGQTRFYLHSKTIRWSNGAAKGSAIDLWHERLSFLPLPDILPEIVSVGFKGVVVDRSVLPADHYQNVREILTKYAGAPIVQDDAGKIAFWKLPAAGFELYYDEAYRRAVKLVVSRRIDMTSPFISRTLDKAVLGRLMEKASSFPVVFDRASYPNLFLSERVFDRGLGQEKIAPIADMKGDTSCHEVDNGSAIELTVSNRSDFDWKMNSGEFPIRIGVHLYKDDGSIARPDGVWIPTDAYIPVGGSVTLKVPKSEVFQLSSPERIFATFALVQDANAWFSQAGNVECRVERK